MNSKVLLFFALFVVLIACTLGQTDPDSRTIKLHVFDSSSVWWIAVDPRDELFDTASIEVREDASTRWVAMLPNPGWGYFQLSSTSGTGFDLPLSFRLTATNGAQVELNAILTTIRGGALVDTGAQYAQGQAPTTRPTQPATQAPTQRPTSAPTQRPTAAPTTRPTEAPTTRPTQAATQAPTQPPTQAATQAPTQPPTQAATQAPTQPPTQRPTQAATQPPTQRPTQAATQPPTQRPTQAATQPATQAPTPRPTSSATKAPTTAPNTDLCALVPTSSEPIKILVPLYVYPGAAWDQVVAAAQSGVKIIAIINPNSGPSTGPDSSYNTYMKKLTNAGVEIVGYVHTLWGARDITQVKNEIDIYATKFTGVSGIFLDEGSAQGGDVPYYTTVYNHIISKSGFKHVILNPGVQPDQKYLSITTNIVIYEDYASSLSKASFASFVKCAPSAAAKANYKYKFSGIVHTASLSDMSSIVSRMANLGMGLVYVTDGAGGCCTYNTLASYFSQEAAAVDALN